MILHPQAREFYALAVDSVPAATSWEASFDEGISWHTGVLDDGAWRWLVAGPDVEQGTAVAVVTARANPLIRATETPEVIVRDAPAIVVRTS